MCPFVGGWKPGGDRMPPSHAIAELDVRSELGGGGERAFAPQPPGGPRVGSDAALASNGAKASNAAAAFWPLRVQRRLCRAIDGARLPSTAVR